MFVIDSCLEMDGVTKPMKKQTKSLFDKSVNTVSSFGMDTETVDIEQREIIKLKESIIELFHKPEPENEGVNVLFRLDDVEEILQENYVKITDMTDKLKAKLYSTEKEMVDNFDNTILEKEMKFEEEKNELIVKTRNNVLQDIAGVFTELIDAHMAFVDNKVEKILIEHDEDINIISKAIESIVVQNGESVVSKQEKSDIPEKLVHKIEQFFQTEENMFRVLESKEDISTDHIDVGMEQPETISTSNVNTSEEQNSHQKLISFQGSGIWKT